MNRERLKTLILSILVAISVLLTQQLWFSSPFKALLSKSGYNQTHNLTLTEERKAIISPSTIIVSFGAGDRRRNHYTVLSSKLDYDVWHESKNILEDYFLGDPEITPITYDEYIQNNVLRSVELEFSDNIPTILISSIFDSLENKVVRNIKDIRKILVPAFNRGIIYIVDSNEDIYEVKLSDYESNSSLDVFIDELENTEYTKYHPILSFFDELDSI